MKLSSAAAMAATLLALTAPQTRADEPLQLARDGFMYVGGHVTHADGQDYYVGQMYVEIRIPAKQTHSVPIIMVHGGSMSGTNYTGTPDGREGWAQYFVRHGYPVYVVDQVARGRSGFLSAVEGPMHPSEAGNSLARFVDQQKYKLWPQAVLHTQWPGTGAPDDPSTIQLAESQLPAIADFRTQQPLNRDALIALLEKIGPSILLTHSQAGAFTWPTADARPDLIKAIVAVEPNGPPFHSVDEIGAPDWFKDGPLALPYGVSILPLQYSPAVKDAADLKPEREAKADGDGLVRCWMQKEPAHQLPNLQKMPIMVLSSEASYHAPYDNCSVKYLRQAGVKVDWLRLAALGIHGNSHMMMVERNNQQIAEVIASWLDKVVPAGH